MMARTETTPTRIDLSGSQHALLEERLTRARQVAGRPADNRPSIRRRPCDTDIPLSFAQERLWFLDQLEPGSAVYNVCQAVRMQGRLSIAALERALNAIIARHEVLRANFAAADGQPVQVIASERVLPLAFVDLAAAGCPPESGELARRLAEESRRPFDLARDLLIRVLLVRTSPTEHTLLLTSHHIISDGWSLGILFRELATLYPAFCRGEAAALPELPIQYADYVFWERDTLQGPVLERQLAFWRKQLAGLPTVLELPVDHPRGVGRASRGASRAVQLSAALSRELKVLAQREGATLFMVLLAAFQALLYRWTGQEDIAVGSVVAGRRKVELEKLIGFFVNTLVFRGDLSGEPTFRQLLARTREVAFEVFAHQDLPFERLVKELRPDRSLSRNPLFQVTFVLQNAPMVPTSLPQLRLQPMDVDTSTSKFDLTLSMIETGDGLRADLEYNADLFAPATIARMLGAFQTLLGSIVADPDQPISRLAILTPLERHQLIVAWNDTATEYSRDATIAPLFVEQVGRDPEAVAVTLGSRRLTYRELDERSNQLAWWLRRAGVGPETLVGVCLERSVELIVALLGIIKAGGTYVSLDPTYPSERLAFMLCDTASPVLLTQKKLRSRVEAFAASRPSSPAPGAPAAPSVLCLDLEWARVARESVAAVPCAVTPDNLAYISYTSGSTGRPKGVCVPHRGVVRLVRNTNYAQFGPDEVILQFAPIAFDASTLEIWGALLNGGRLVICPPGPASLSELGELIASSGVTTLWLTAGLFHQMIEEQVDRLKNVRQLLAGGDVLSPAQVARALEHLPRTRLINGYGPTENTTFTCCHHVTTPPAPGRSVPIGRPIANTQAFILDSHLQPVPIGVPGELFAGGDGLARGYLNRPVLTAEKFVPNPFADGGRRPDGHAAVVDGAGVGHGLRSAPDAATSGAANDERERADIQNPAAGGERGDRSHPAPCSAFDTPPRGASVPARMYRTGDRARWLSDGTIEFLGRIDRQVKIRGFRVEPAEIEAVLGLHPAIRECAVVVREDTGEKRLVAYVVPQTKPAPAADVWRAYLGDKLPDYLVPSAFFTLDALPLNANGKLDVPALPADCDVRAELHGQYLAPRDEIERQLVAIWENVLNVRPIGVRDQFFALGGHSLLAVRVAAQVEKTLGRKLPVAAIFQHRTIDKLAALLRASELRYVPSGSIVEIRGPGSRPRLYLVHGVGGGMFWGYVNLARHLGADQPLYAFKSRGLDGLPEWPTIEELAASYLAELRIHQPAGPYLLGGYCFGGMVAYEMARQLREQGEDVALLALINGSPPNTSYQRPSGLLSPLWLAKFLANFGYWVGCFLFRWTWPERLGFLRWKMRRLRRRAGAVGGRKPAEVALGEIDQLVDLAAYSEERRALWRAHVRALLDYHPLPYSGRVTLLRTHGHQLVCSFDRQYGWGELARDGVDVRIVRGGHGNVLAEPFVRGVAEALRPCLDAAGQRAKKAGA